MTRWSRASSGASSTQLEAAPPSPWTSRIGGPSPPTNQRSRTPFTGARRSAKPLEDETVCGDHDAPLFFEAMVLEGVRAR